VLPDQGERIGQQIKSDGEAAASAAHHRFVNFERILMLLEH
jgi:hypothetical protein